MNSKNKRGFTLVEIMIVVMIIGLIMAIAVPNLLMARENAAAKTCIGNLRQILQAKQMFAMESRSDGSTQVNWEDIQPYLRGTQPECPTGGTYDLKTVADSVTCSQNGHVLP